MPLNENPQPDIAAAKQESQAALEEGARTLEMANRVLTTLNGKKLSAGTITELQKLRTDIETLQTRLQSQQLQSAKLTEGITRTDELLIKGDAIRRNIAIMEAKVTLTAPGEWSKFVDNINATFIRIEDFEIDPERTNAKFAELQKAYAFAKKMYNDNYLQTPGDGTPSDQDTERVAYMAAALRMFDVIATTYEEMKGGAPNYAKIARETMADKQHWASFVDRSNAAMQRKSWYQVDPERSGPKLAPLESAYAEGKKLYDDNYVETRPETKPDAALVTRFAAMLRGLSTIEDANKAYAAVRGETPPFVRNARKEAERYMGSSDARNEIISYIDTLWKRWDDVKAAMKAMPPSPAIAEISSMLERANDMYGDSHAGMGKNVEDTTKAMMAVGLIETALDTFDALPSATVTKTAPAQTATTEAPLKSAEQTEPAPVQPKPTVRARGMTPTTENDQPDAAPVTEQPATVAPAPTVKPAVKPAPAVDPEPEQTPDTPKTAVSEASAPAPAAPEPPEVPGPAPAVTETPVSEPETAPSLLRTEGDTIVLFAPTATLTYRLDDGRTMDAGIALSAGSTKVTMPGSFTAERSFEGWRITPDAGVSGIFTFNTGNETVSVRVGGDAATMEAPQKTVPSAPEQQRTAEAPATYVTRASGRPLGPVRRFIQRMRNRR